MSETVANRDQAGAADGGAFMERLIGRGVASMNQTGAADPRSRLHRVMPTVIRRLHELVREIGLTESELMAVLAFLTEVGRQDEMVLLSDVMGVSVHANHNSYGEAFEGNRASVEGPYYLNGAELKQDGDIAGDGEPGIHLEISGRITDARTGAPVPDAVLDFWQADDAAIYDLDGYHLRGKVKADRSGRYRAHTIKPAGYSIGIAEHAVADLLQALGRRRMRPAHLHLKVFAEGYRDLTTQIFFADDPDLDDDAIFSVTDDLVVSPRMDPSGKRGSFEFDIALVPSVSP